MRFIAALLVLAQVMASPQPAGAQDQSGGSCDDLAQQIAAEARDLDQLQADALPWLISAGQFGALAPSDLSVAALQGLPGLTPGLAQSSGAIAAELGALIDAWRSSHATSASASYWHELSDSLGAWDSRFSPLIPFQGSVASLVGLSTALGQLDQLAARAQADLALEDSLNSALQDCQAQTPPPDTAGNPAGGDTGQVLCEVGGQAGHSNSECFRLELDAAFATWEACTEAYFAAERQAFQTGGDPPTNTCDPEYAAQQEQLQRQWGGPP